MTVQTDYTKGLGLWGLKKKKSQALLGTVSLLILGLILVLTWESTGIGAFSVVFSQQPPKLVALRLGDGVETNALLASSEELLESGRKLEVHGTVWKEADDVKSQNSNHSRDLTKSDPVTEEKPSEKKPNSSKSQTSKKSPSSGDALIARDETSKPIESDSGSRSKSDVCDFTQGYWVMDEKRPFYSGKECKAYLSYSFACRLMTRPDFEFEKLRWQPEGCDLPSFTANGFLERMRNKVVAFVGDSLGRQQFQSLMCMVTQGKDDTSVKDVTWQWGRDTKWAYRFPETNTTILFHWSVSLNEIEGGNPQEEEGFSAMHLDRPAAFLQEFFDQIDVLVLNTGHHWSRGKLETNKWHRYVNGKPLVDRKLAGIGHSLNFSVHTVVKWLDEKLADGKQKPAVFFRTLSPRHFKNGDWNSGGKCDASRSSFGPNMTEAKPAPVYNGPITELIAGIAVRGTRVKLLNVTHLSQFREEGHISKYGFGKDSEHQDCLHWCMPGVPDVWNELLYAELLTHDS